MVADRVYRTLTHPLSEQVGPSEGLTVPQLQRKVRRSDRPQCGLFQFGFNHEEVLFFIPMLAHDVYRRPYP